MERSSQRWIRLAEKAAANSKHKRHKMGAVVFKTGRVLSKAPNGSKTGRHAEVRALSKDTNFEGASIVICHPQGERISRPCRACFFLIRSVGIRKMYFVDEEGRQVVKNVAEENELDYRDYCQDR